MGQARSAVQGVLLTHTQLSILSIKMFADSAKRTNDWAQRKWKKPEPWGTITSSHNWSSIHCLEVQRQHRSHQLCLLQKSLKFHNFSINMINQKYKALKLRLSQGFLHTPLTVYHWRLELLFVSTVLGQTENLGYLDPPWM